MTIPNEVATLTTDDLRQLYTLMAAQDHPVTLHFQKAGERVAMLAARLLADEPDELQDDLVASVADRSIVVLTGGGDTGTIGLHAARFLAEQDAWVQVLTLAPSEAHTGLAADALNLMLEADVPLAWADEGWELPPCDLLIDAMNGFDHSGLADSKSDSATNAMRAGALLPLIELANSSLAPILSIGAPSSTKIERQSNAAAQSIFVKATATLSFGLPHDSLLDASIRAASGDLYLADVDISSDLLKQLNISLSDLPDRFAATPLIRL